MKFRKNSQNSIKRAGKCIDIMEHELSDYVQRCFMFDPPHSAIRARFLFIGNVTDTLKWTFFLDKNLLYEFVEKWRCFLISTTSIAHNLLLLWNSTSP